MNQEQKRAHWAAIVEEQQHSSLSIKRFCADKDISYQTFFYWAKQLRLPEESPTLQPIVINDVLSANLETVVLTFASGIRAEFPATLSHAHLAVWLDALK